MLAAATAVVLAFLAASSTTEAFVRLNGNSEFYARCEPEGSYCFSDSGCCDGLECATGRNNMQDIGGICRPRSNNGPVEAHQALPSSPVAAPASTNFDLSSHAANFLSRSCVKDSDCGAGQCCNRRPIGFRGSLVASCNSDCDYKQLGDLLGDYYSRFYRRASRAGSHHRQQHQQQQKSRHHDDEHDNDEDDEDKKKKKKKKSAN